MRLLKCLRPLRFMLIARSQSTWLTYGIITMFGLITLVWSQRQAINPQQYYTFTAEIRNLQTLQEDVKSDVLKTRFGLDLNYDHLTYESDELRRSWLRLQQQGQKLLAGHPELKQQFQAIEPLLQNQAEAIERYKSQNAILQNSLRYLPIVTHQAHQIDVLSDQIGLHDHLDELLQHILIYNLNADEALANPIQQEIVALEAYLPTISQPLQVTFQDILLHTKALLRLKPEVAQLIARSLDARASQTVEQFRSSYDRIQTQNLEWADRLRWVMYSLCLGLMGLVMWLYRIRDRAVVLQQANHQLEQTVQDRTGALQQTLSELQASQSQLIHAEKMSGLGQLVAGIAHEINNPVSFIYSNANPALNYMTDMMGIIQHYQATYPQPPETVTDYLEKIDWAFIQQDFPAVLTSMKTGADRIREIVLSLRNFSRLDEDGKKQADLNEGITSTLLILQHRLRAQSDRGAIAVTQDLGQIPLVMCYPSQVNQVIMNILANAIDALEEQLLVKEPDYQPAIHIWTIADQDCVRIEIADNGAGIPEAVKQKLFDPFFTTKPVGKGTGLGMSISYQIIVERHGGKIYCDSTVGEGTQFTIELPLMTREET
jgi:signal transduction histidine kinase